MKRMVVLLVCFVLMTGAQRVEAAEPENVCSRISEMHYTAQYVPWWLAEEPALDIDLRLPQILDETPDARAFNREMAAFAEDVKKQKIIYYHSSDWQCYVNNSMVSIVVSLRDLYDYGWDYRVFTYDFQQGKQVPMEQLPGRLGWTREAYERRLLKTAAGAYERQALRDYREGLGDPETFLMGRARTLSESNLQNVLLYAGEHESLHGILTLADSIHGGAFYQDLLLIREENAEAPKKVTLDNVTAELKDQRVFVTLEEENGPGMYLPPDAIEPGKPYEIQGLYGSYQDLALGYLGNDGTICLALLDLNGSVTCCNLSHGVMQKGDFCAVGPFPDKKAGTGFQAEGSEDGWDLYLLYEDGSRKSLWEIQEKLEQGAFRSLGDTEWKTEKGDLTLRFRLNPDFLNGFAPAALRDCKGLLASGQCFYDGMTREGMRFGGLLYRETGGALTVCYRRVFHTDWEGDGLRSTLELSSYAENSSYPKLSPLIFYQAE